MLILILLLIINGDEIDMCFGWVLELLYGIVCFLGESYMFCINGMYKIMQGE